MKKTGRRLSIFSLPEVKEYYSIPIFNAHERDYFLPLLTRSWMSLKVFIRTVIEFIFS